MGPSRKPDDRLLLGIAELPLYLLEDVDEVISVAL